MNWKIDERSYQHISALTIKYRTYLDSNSERFIYLCIIVMNSTLKAVKIRPERKTEDLTQ